MQKNRQEMLVRFENHLRNYQGFSNHTVRAYVTKVKRYLSWLQEGPITVMSVDQFISSQKKSGNSRQNTIFQYLIGIRKFLEYLSNCNIIDRNWELVKLPQRETYKKKDNIPEEYIKKIINAPLKYEKDHYIGIRNHLIYRLGYETGCRVSEITSIRFSDISESGEINILGKGNKTRSVFISSGLLHSIEKLRKSSNQDELVFKSKYGVSIDPHSIGQKTHRYCKRLGLPLGTGMHTLRHFFATHSLKTGVPISVVKDMMGHSDIRTTSLYLHVTHEDIKKGFLIHQMAL